MAAEGLKERINEARPAIHIVAEDGADRGTLAYMLEGIEEEGIPADMAFEPAAGPGAAAIAFRAASESRLGVGIGITAREAVIHFDKLSVGNPLFRESLPGKADDIRVMGSNAARLVKRMPFKGL
ncbi:MAG: glycerol dehydratase reactivase beta/small subunit family protein [Clostridiales Family XIII bacterium]|jgi:hypothetical protein|nr:glycerol dehydratase reactivase beta/small subunit family protein [Clostridiales Family XIII bacterium]